MASENHDLRASAASDAVAAVQNGIRRVPTERSQFRAFIVSNPNYFGNLKLSPFPAVLNIQGNSTYEEIGCVGFHPQFERLDAVVYVKQPYGYGGDVGMRLRGTYSVSDEHFGSLSITVEPASAANGATVSPSARAYPVVSTAGESSTWTLDTTGMDPCGYVIRMDVWDRTIVSGGSGWHDYATVGFCLKAADSD